MLTLIYSLDSNYSLVSVILTSLFYFQVPPVWYPDQIVAQNRCFVPNGPKHIIQGESYGLVSSFPLLKTDKLPTGKDHTILMIFSLALILLDLQFKLNFIVVSH